MTAAEWFVNVLTAYAALGLAFGLPFVTFGIGRLDPNARGSGPGFRMLVLPGVVALWPLLLRRWLLGGRRQ